MTQPAKIAAVLGLSVAACATASDAGARTAAHAAAPTTVIHGCLGKPYQHPSGYVLACGDGNSALEDLHWTNWGAATATATGKDIYNTCKPSCVAGHLSSYPVTVTATKRTRSGSTFTYGELLIVAGAGAPKGTPHTFKVPTGAKGPFT